MKTLGQTLGHAGQNIKHPYTCFNAENIMQKLYEYESLNTRLKKKQMQLYMYVHKFIFRDENVKQKSKMITYIICGCF